MALTPKDIEESIAASEAIRARVEATAPSRLTKPWEKDYRMAGVEEAYGLKNLEAIGTDAGLSGQRLIERRRVSEAKLTLGKFDEALEYADSEELQGRISAIKEAVDKPDDARCGCSDNEDSKGNIIRSTIKAKTIFSPTHGGFVSLLRCHKCGHLNATNTP